MPGPRLRLIPAMTLRNGQPSQVHPAARNPSVEAQARLFEEWGAGEIQVIDLDAAEGGRNQWLHIGRLMHGLEAHVHAGGGIRHMTQVQQMLDLGANRVIIGTQGVRNPAWLREVARIFPGRVLLALDLRGREAVVEARTTPSGVDAVDLLASLDGSPLAGCTLAGLDGPVAHDLVAQLRLAAPGIPLMVAYPDATLEDLESLGDAGVEAAILSDSLYDGRLDLVSALEAYPSPPRWPVHVLAAADEAMDG